MELLAGNRQSGYRGCVERIKCIRAGVTNVIDKERAHFFHDLVQSESLAVCSRHRLGELRQV